MNFLKIKLLVVAVIMFAASSAFASLSYNVSVDTTSLAGSTGYLYLQYIGVDAVASTAMVSNFASNGVLGAQDTINVVNGAAVTGTLPGNVAFANTNGINDYNHAITFGNSLSFLVSFASTPGSPSYGASTLSLGLFGDAFGGSPLLNTNGGQYAGTVALVNLNNDGSTSAQALVNEASATPTPVPAAAWLLGSGLMGLVGLRRKEQKG